MPCDKQERMLKFTVSARPKQKRFSFRKGGLCLGIVFNLSALCCYAQHSVRPQAGTNDTLSRDLRLARQILFKRLDGEGKNLFLSISGSFHFVHF